MFLGCVVIFIVGFGEEEWVVFGLVSMLLWEVYFLNSFLFFIKNRKFCCCGGGVGVVGLVVG